MDIARVLAWAVVLMLSLSISIRIVRWLRRNPDKRDLALGDLLQSEQSIDAVLVTLRENAQKEAGRYLLGSVCITALLIMVTTPVLLAQTASDQAQLLIANVGLWCGLGVAMYMILMVQLFVALRKARQALLRQRHQE